MALVEGDYCPKVSRRCIDSEYNKANHITLCHEFAPGTKCLVPRKHQRFCIDKYEYPNKAGAHPPWMVSWYDAAATCKSKGKRLCYSDEWVMACEGPEETPFPYGWKRDHSVCNIDNVWIIPKLKRLYSRKPGVADAELERLDQSAPSGSLAGCKSGYGVYDLTGNMDEWVNSSEAPRSNSRWAGLKGGAWGHVRNACRPMTTSHPPDFKYYFVAFRCCADAAGSPPTTAPKAERPPKVKGEDRAPLPHVTRAPGPSKRKVGGVHRRKGRNGPKHR